jgi:hypothetical protein
MGYAAGAHDMARVFRDILTLPEFSQPQRAATAIHGIDQLVACMDQHAFGGLGQFRDWASRFWVGSDKNAAELLLIHACD